jgi:glucoamylase
MSETAPAAPGTPASWTSSAKDMVGRTLRTSRQWFTLGFGIVNEVYYPRVDIPQIRDLGFIVADGEGFWAEVNRIDNYELRVLAPACRRSRSSTATNAIHWCCGSRRDRGAMCW